MTARLPNVRPGDALLSCLLAAARRDTEPSAYASLAVTDPVALVAASRSHGVDHLLHDWITIVAPGHAAVPLLRRCSDESARFHLRALGALRSAGTALDAAGVAYVAVKGPILATLARTSSVRAYGDLDLLVSPKQLEIALDALARTGAEISESARWKVLYESEHAQVPMTLPLGVALDLHWDLCSRPHMRRSWTVEGAEALILRSALLHTAVGEVPVLDRADMLLHTAGHAGWSGGDRLGWLVDVDSVVRSGPVDWDTVMNRTRRWGLEAHVGDVLQRTGRLLGTPIPIDVMKSLRGGALGSLLRMSTRLFPMTGEFHGGSAPRLLRLDARSGLASTLPVVARRAYGAVSRRAHPVDPVDVVEPRRVDDETWRGPYLSFATTGSAPRLLR